MKFTWVSCSIWICPMCAELNIFVFIWWYFNGGGGLHCYGLMLDNTSFDDSPWHEHDRFTMKYSLPCYRKVVMQHQYSHNANWYLCHDKGHLTCVIMNGHVTHRNRSTKSHQHVLTHKDISKFSVWILVFTHKGHPKWRNKFLFPVMCRHMLNRWQNRDLQLDREVERHWSGLNVSLLSLHCQKPWILFHVC